MKKSPLGRSVSDTTRPIRTQGVMMEDYELYKESRTFCSGSPWFVGCDVDAGLHCCYFRIILDVRVLPPVVSVTT